MAAPRQEKMNEPVGLLALIVLQTVCGLFFLADIVSDYREIGTLILSDVHLMIEAMATLTLIAAVIVEIKVLTRMRRREALLVERLGMARAAVEDVIAAHFEIWGLSPSERDVAHFLVRGMSIAETAALRGSAEGTVKAHLNAIYRKSGTRNRAELMSALIDALMGAETQERASEGAA